MNTQRPVAVLCGGASAEHDISMHSGYAVLQALHSVSVEAELVPVDENLVRQLCRNSYRCVFIAVHGWGGEDGILQGLLEAMSIPYTGSGVLASALAGDKIRCKYVWRAAGLPTPDFVRLSADSDWSRVTEVLGSVFIKPAAQGSSIGIRLAETPEEVAAAYAAATVHDSEVLAESAVKGSEYTVSILNDTALPALHIDVQRGFYDYVAKYEDSGTRLDCPAGLSESEEIEIRALAERAFAVLGCSGWGRVDLMRDTEKCFQLLEVNTVPGMTERSLLPRAAAEAGIGFGDLVLRILRTAEECGQ